MKVDGRIISGNFRVKSKVDFLIEIFMQFFLKGNWIQILMVYLFLTLQSSLFQNSSDPDVTPNIIYLLLLLQTWNPRKIASSKIQLKYL